MVKVEVNGNNTEMEGNANNLGQLLGYAADGEIIRQIVELLSQGKSVEYEKLSESKTYKLTPIDLSGPPQGTVKM